MTIIKKTLKQISNHNPTTQEQGMIQQLNQMRDSQINFSDIPEIDWDKVNIVKKPIKKQIAFRIDSDTLEFFQKKGKGYQTRMNEVLKSFVQHERA